MSADDAPTAITTSTTNAAPPAAVIEAFGLDPFAITALTGGLINQSFRVRRGAGEDAVLQRVNPIFPAAVNDDIDAVTRHLQARGLVTPRLIRTAAGASCFVHEGAVWRLLSFVAGETFESLSDAAQAHEAARVLGAFHAALSDFDAPLRSRRPGVHDTARHLAHLKSTLAARTDHDLQTPTASLAREILDLADAIGPLPALPDRLVHGDPKISNIVFAGGRAVCLVDLDTISRFPAPLELGDALRSWCNLAAEDSEKSRFSLERFEAAIAGYRAGAGSTLGAGGRLGGRGQLGVDEWRAVPTATLTIAVELAARFAADALTESYFGWDRRRFARAGEHNLARAGAQLKLARSMREALPAMRRAVSTVR